MVPKWLQTALWRVYVPGQEVRKVVTPGYLLVQTRCRLEIARREGHPAAAGLLVHLGGTLRQAAASRGPHPDSALDDESIVQLFDKLIGSR